MLRIITLLILTLSINFDLLLAQEINIFRLIPEDVNIFVTINYKKDDRGLLHFKKILREKFMEKEIVFEKRSAILNMYDLVDDINIFGSIFFDEKGKTYNSLIILEFPQRFYERKSLLEKEIGALITKKQPLKQTKYSNNLDISYTIDRYPKEFSCYTAINNMIVVANNLNLLRKSIDMFVKGTDHSVSLPFFNFIDQNVNADKDCQIFIDNKDNKFINALKIWEQKYNMQLILSGRTLNKIKLELDIVDEDSMIGAIELYTKTIFHPFDDAKDDLLFLNEIIRRKCLAEAIDYDSDMQIHNDSLTLNFLLSNLKNTWQRVINDERNFLKYEKF